MSEVDDKRHNLTRPQLAGVVGGLAVGIALAATIIAGAAGTGPLSSAGALSSVAASTSAATQAESAAPATSAATTADPASATAAATTSENVATAAVTAAETSESVEAVPAEAVPAATDDATAAAGAAPANATVSDVAATTATPAPAPAPATVSNTITVTVTIDGSAAGGGVQQASVALDRGASVYDALVASGASVNARGTGYGVYVAGINGLAEKEHGSGSGWVYAVNGVEPQTSCSSYQLRDDANVVWTYVNVTR